MEAAEALTLNTDMQLKEYDTSTSEKFETKNKNRKILSLIYEKIRRKRGSSESTEEWTWDDYYGQQMPQISYVWTDVEQFDRLLSGIKEIIEVYINENKVSNLEKINEWLVKEYTVYNSIELLHSLVDTGKEIFRDARPRNELESKSINAFIQSKAKTIRIR